MFFLRNHPGKWTVVLRSSQVTKNTWSIFNRGKSWYIERVTQGLKEPDKPNEKDGTQKLATQKEQEATTTLGWEELRAMVPYKRPGPWGMHQARARAVAETQLLPEMQPWQWGERRFCFLPSFHPLTHSSAFYWLWPESSWNWEMHPEEVWEGQAGRTPRGAQGQD